MLPCWKTLLVTIFYCIMSSMLLYFISIYIYRGNLNQRNKLFDIISSERSMTDAACNRDPDASSLRAYQVDEKNTYSVGSTGASVTSDSSVNLIQQYCEKLSRYK